MESYNNREMEKVKDEEEARMIKRNGIEEKEKMKKNTKEGIK